MVDYAKTKGAKGIQLGGICCTANEIFQRHGVPQAGTYLQQELAIITGACDAMVVDIQCVFQNLANVAKCFHTKLITTHPIAKMEQDNVVHIEFDEHHALEDAEKIVRMAIDNFENRGAEVMIPQYKSSAIGGFGVESIEYHLGGTFRGTYYTLNDNIINGRIRGVAGVVGCNNARTRHNEAHIAVVKELIKKRRLVLTTGCNGIACAMEGLLTPESAGFTVVRAWPKSVRRWVSRRFCTWDPAWTTAASCWPPRKWSKPVAWAKTSAICRQPAPPRNG
jgi:carbon-monoxide dehydrogenase catalytic subunit